MLVERAAKKRKLALTAASHSKDFKKLMAAKEQARLQLKAALAEKMRTQGLSGQKLGKHKVPEEQIEVQLGEDRSDSLRAMKVRLGPPLNWKTSLYILYFQQVEGNLFKDRFLSLQRRALLEPRVPVL